MFALIQTFKNVLRISNVLCYSTEFTSNICSLVINHGDKQFRNFTANEVFNQYKALIL